MSMLFSHLIGNPKAKEFLERLVGADQIPQVLLFEGPVGVGKRSFAMAFAEGILGKEHARKVREGTHPDVYLFSPEGKNGLHPIASIKQLIEEVSLPPFEGLKKVYILEEAERMLPSSSNALLKTLEEPIQNAHILLLSSHREEMLPTILSRCCRVPFYPIEERELCAYLVKNLGVNEAKALQAAVRSHGSLSKAKELLEQSEDPARTLFLDILKNYFISRDELDLLERLGQMEKLLDKKQPSEEEGILSDQVDLLFEDLFYWVRDLQLIALHGNKEKVFHVESMQNLEDQCKKGFVPSLEKIHQEIEISRLAIQRNIKPKVVLQQLFARVVA
jgi:DNA polymerase III subunit delta'